MTSLQTIETMSQGTADAVAETAMTQAKRIAAREGGRVMDHYSRLMTDFVEGRHGGDDHLDPATERRVRLAKLISQSNRAVGGFGVNASDLEGGDDNPPPDPGAGRRIEMLIAALGKTADTGERRSIVQKLNALLLVD